MSFSIPLSIILFLGISAYSEALLKYRSSSSFSKTRLQIENSGLVIINESDALGKNDWNTSQISQEQIDKLHNIIFSLDHQDIQEFPVKIDDQKVGALAAYQNGREIAILSIRSDLYEIFGNAQQNTSCSILDLNWLKELIYPLVKNKLKLRWSKFEREIPPICDFDLSNEIPQNF